jgi:hypothetical protein
MRNDRWEPFFCRCRNKYFHLSSRPGGNKNNKRKTKGLALNSEENELYGTNRLRK